MAHQYFAENLASHRPGETVELDGAEAKHAWVARLSLGERVRLTDGQGQVGSGLVREATAAGILIELESVAYRADHTPRLGIAQALAKGDRDERAVQAAVELGVSDVVPWQSARSVVRWDQRKGPRGRERWQTIADEAAKQSMRVWRARVHPAVDTNGLVGFAVNWHLVVLDPQAKRGLADLELDGRHLMVIVGPEGGIEPAELQQLDMAGASSVHLGAEVLRTSTAGPAALAALALRLGRWAAPRYDEQHE